MSPNTPLPVEDLSNRRSNPDIELPAFDVCGPLPGPGVTLLEASAGTGKTYTIAALMARLLADGVADVSDILAVTFTRMATSELRDRIRARLVLAEEALGRWLESGSVPPDADDVIKLLVEADRDTVTLRHVNISRALANFDSATVTTIHTFCQLVLSGLGVAGQVAEGAKLLEDPRDLVSEVVDDVFLARSLGPSGAPEFGRGDAGKVGEAAVANASTALEPADERLRTTVPGRRRRLAEAVRAQTRLRLADANLLTYDDMLIRLREALRDDESGDERGEAARLRLRRRYRVVLVDEFQDTDPVQWEVVQRAFGQGDTILVLIGDPKQAIYGFRGADVFAYLSAAGAAGQQFTLGTNWRSDAGLLRGLAALFDPLSLGHPDIPYRPVDPSLTHHLPGLAGAPCPDPLRLRIVHHDDGHLIAMNRDGSYQKGAAVDWVAKDLAGDIVALLSSGAELVERDADGAEIRRRTIRPGDVAVLVETNRQTFLVQDALRSAGVPAVVAAAESVFKTSSAKHWLSLLEALEQPADRGRAVSVALSHFFGMTGDEVASADDRVWEHIQDRLRQWEDLIKRRGVSALGRAVLVSEQMAARLLRHADGERLLTDLDHVAQLLHAEASSSQAGLSGLRAWLARRIEEAGQDQTDSDDRARRLDTDVDAVQVLTVHRAKGLEFPVVYCPYLWDIGFQVKPGPPIVFHTETGERKLDVGGLHADNPDYQDHFASYFSEERGEDLRQLYVALTRAKNQVVIWWAAVVDAQETALSRLLLSRLPDGTVPSEGPKRRPPDDVIQSHFAAVAARAPGCMSVERASGGEGRCWTGGDAEPTAALRVAELNRPLDLSWRRTSYSGITAATHDHQIGSEPEDVGTVDEPPGAGPAAVVVEPQSTGTGTDEASLRSVPSAWADLPGGADVGTFVHEVLEEADFASADIDGELARVLQIQRRRGRADRLGAPLAGALLTALETPLGPLAGDMPLRDIGRTDRLDEVTFELPLAGGDQPVGRVLTEDLAALMAAHAAGDGVLAGYAERLRDPLLAPQLRGYLTGSIDLVFRQATADGDHRYFIVDYKTNWLGPEGEPLSAWHYRPSALDAEMQHAHYPLQGLLYSVALHRYLRWRLPDYDPHRHLGGMLYLFLRGMTGADVPVVSGQPCGVFSWATPPGLVVALSDLLASGSPVAAGV
ncbi:MAG: UvrD-helicase domain-containing protein [Acidimicrobiales bacterium]